MKLKELAKEIEKIAKGAGQLIINNRYQEIIEKDGVSNIVTDMDVASQKYIIERCLALLPESCILAEEDGQQQIGEGYTWIIDPIDGTTNYAYDFKHSCISIALYYQRKGLIGVVYDPYLKESFVGIEKEGSYVNDKKIHVSSHSFKQALVMVGTSPYDKSLADKTFTIMKQFFLQARDVRRSGSAALDICYLASGRIDAFYEHSLQPWDYAAGLIILKNANGCAKSLTPHAFEKLQPTGLVMSNQVCFDDCVALVEAYDE